MINYKFLSFVSKSVENFLIFIQVEIATLEASVKSELEEKNDILDQLMKERGTIE